MNFDREIFFGKNIKYLREERGILQSELGDMIGVGRTTISGYETGNSRPELNVFIELSNIFEVNADDLLFKDISSFGRNRPKLVKQKFHKNPPVDEQWKPLIMEILSALNIDVNAGKVMGDFKNDVFFIQHQLTEIKKELRAIKKEKEKLQ